MTVADLAQKGAAALDDAGLKQLIEGKYIWLRNTVTGEVFKEVFDGGQVVTYHVNKTVTQPSEVGDVAESGYLGTSSAYSITDGKLVTSLAGTPFQVTFYKLGDKYVGARSNEFGYANYEVIPPPNNLKRFGERLTHSARDRRGQPSLICSRLWSTG